MRLYLLVALGGALGTVLRFSLSEVAQRWWGDGFPWATLIINVSGSLLIGFIYTATTPGGRWPLEGAWRQMAMLGFCGGFTTFSAFSLQTLELVRRDLLGRAAANVVASVVVCLTAVWVGHLLALALQPVRTSS